MDYRGVEVLITGFAGKEHVEFFPEATEFRYLDNGQRLEVLAEGKPVASVNGSAVRIVHYTGVTEASRQRVEIRARVAEQRATPSFPREMASHFTEEQLAQMGLGTRANETGPAAPRASQADPAGAAMPAGDEGRDVHATEPELRAQQLTQEGTPPADAGPLGGVPDAVKDAERAEKADAKAAEADTKVWAQTKMERAEQADETAAEHG